MEMNSAAAIEITPFTAKITVFLLGVRK